VKLKVDEEVSKDRGEWYMMDKKTGSLTDS
jgi:hypothetical protein